MEEQKPVKASVGAEEVDIAENLTTPLPPNTKMGLITPQPLPAIGSSGHDSELE